MNAEETLSSDELECKICYQKFNTHSRKPKILNCLHRVCARCLSKILLIGGGAPCISCPFCRNETELQEEEVAGLPDDTNILSKLAERTICNSDSNEVVLTPKNLASSSPSHGSSNCLVITIMEVQRDSTTDAQSKHHLGLLRRAQHGLGFREFPWPNRPRPFFQVVQPCPQDTGLAAGLLLLRLFAPWNIFASYSEGDTWNCLCKPGTLQPDCMPGLRLLPVLVPRHVRLLSQELTNADTTMCYVGQ
ncbi:unnamed protein product [Staurois parvus]|uniref:E3 ubiquitin-protein ligase RNF182 n=1 Tax=Staurois parvus TaxID=386267 RepID=A0ABN9D5M5_9NEOB|nr:unnamed protein product [Staurois parvus]